MRQLAVSPSRLHGEIWIPPSKSQTMRAILFASLAKGISKISRYLQSSDTDAMITACKQIGAEIIVSKEQLIITGTAGRPTVPDNVIDARNSGQILQFFSAVCGLIHGCTIITGDHSIRTNRPITELLSGLNQLKSSSLSTRNNGYAPLVINGPISHGQLHIDGAISQPVSAFIIAASFLNGSTEIYVTNAGELPWIDVTLSWLDRLGIKYKNNNYTHYTVFGSVEHNAFDYVVSGDFSSAAYPIVGSLISGSSITVHGLDMQDPQGDKKLIDVLKLHGANIEYDENTRSLSVFPSEVTGGVINVNEFIDAVTILSVLGCYAKGTTTIIGAGVARLKESNRLATMVNELSTLGANIRETDDGLIIKQSCLRGGNVNSHRDHRVAMSLAIAALNAKGSVLINDVGCIDKSYPSFVDSMAELGADIRYI